MIGQIKETIRTKNSNAEAGLKKSLTCSLRSLNKWQPGYKNVQQIRDVTKRVLANLLVRLQTCFINEAIVVAHDLTIWYSWTKYVKALLQTVDVQVIISWSYESERSRFGTNNIAESLSRWRCFGRQGSLVKVINPTEEQIAEFKSSWWSLC